MSRVPTVDADRDSWGTVLNDYLSQGHNSDGSNKNSIPVFNVKDPQYGAIGNGSTDDTTAFGSARDAAGAGGNVVVPPGTYILDALLLNVARQTWTLQPGAVLKLKNSASGGNIIDIRGDRVVVQGGEIDGNKANNATQTSSYSLLVRASNVKVKNVYVHDTPGYGIGGMPTTASAEVSNIEIDGCTVIDSVNAGIFFNYETPTVSSHGIRITNCYCDNSAVSAVSLLGAGIGIYGHTSTVANQPRGSVIANCYVKTRTDVGGVNCFGFNQCNGGEITGCHAEGGDFGYTLPNSQAILMSACTAFGAATYGIEMVGSGSVTGCSIDGNALTSTGIMVNSVSDVAVVGNIIRNLLSGSQTNGIAVTNTGVFPHRIVLADNKIYTTKRGFSLANDIAELVIQGNLVVGDTGGQTQRQGVDANPSSASATRWIIRDNTFIACDLFGFALNFPAVTVSDVWVRDNIFISCGANSTSGTFDTSCVVELTSGGKTLQEGKDITIGGTTGSKIGQSASKIGFYGVTPITRAVLATGAAHTVDDVITALQNLGLVKQA